MFNKWIHLVIPIVDNLPKKIEITCPECNNKTIDYQYIGNPETRAGYLEIWCTSCLKGVHISRVQIPENADFLPFGTPKEEIAKRIPNFKQVVP